MFYDCMSSVVVVWAMILAELSDIHLQKIHTQATHAEVFPTQDPSNTHTHTEAVWPSLCSLLTCVECPVCGARAACRCLCSIMDVPFMGHTDRLSCRPGDEFLFCWGKRMWSHALKIQPMSLATHDLIQASSLCRVPSLSPLLLLLSFAISVSLSPCLSCESSVHLSDCIYGEIISRKMPHVIWLCSDLFVTT